MAQRCGMGRTAFAGYCRELTNTRPIDFLTRCRPEEAARRLRCEAHVAIRDIAADGGFSSAQSFTRCFTAMAFGRRRRTSGRNEAGP